MKEIPIVAHYMDKKFVTLDPDLNIYDAINVLLKKKITGAAVVDKKNHLVGILSEKDCLNVLMQGLYDETPGKKVSEYMIKDIITIAPDTDVLSAAVIFLKNSFRRLLVVNKERKLLGQITRRDLLRVITKDEKKVAKLPTSKVIYDHSRLTAIR